jgi:hypothetical protein
VCLGSGTLLYAVVATARSRSRKKYLWHVQVRARLAPLRDLGETVLNLLRFITVGS